MIFITFKTGHHRSFKLEFPFLSQENQQGNAEAMNSNTYKSQIFVSFLSPLER